MKNKISILFYCLAIVFFIVYLITHRSGFMAFGGLFMIIGALPNLIPPKKK
jgi:hypothetical protein